MLVVAYIGFGNSVYRYHLPYVNLRKDKVKVKYIYRREVDREPQEEIDRELLYPDYIFTSELDDILNDPEVNLIVVNTPDKTHKVYAEVALNHGKNVLVEKPIAMSYDETKELLGLAKEKNLICMPNHNRRYDTDCVSLKDAISSGKLGDIVEVESHYDYYRPMNVEGMEPRMGWLRGLAIHTIDQIISIFGEPNRMHYDVRSLFFESGSDDYYDIDFFYDNLKVIMKTSMLVKTPYPRFIAHGTKGSFIKYGGKHNSSVKWQEPVVIDLDVEDEEDWGRIEYVNDSGETVVETIPSKPTDYGVIYDSLFETIINGKEKLVSDEEVLIDMKIVDEALEACK